MSRRFNIKMSIHPKLIQSFNAIPIKIPARYMEMDNLTLKFLWKCRTQNSQDSLKEEKLDSH